MNRYLAFVFPIAGAVATAAVAIDLGACNSESAGLSCNIGGGCSETQVCSDGIVGCKSNCQCLRGTWQAPCPEAQPRNGTACTGEGATCGYRAENACAGAAGCSCRGGAWTCDETCSEPPDAGADSGGCLAAGGECLFPNVICAVPGPQTCSGNQAGSFCCLSSVANCGQPSTIAYACPPAPEAGFGCTSAPIPLGAPNYEALVQATDDDASYAVGCRVTFPACNNGHVPYCTCTAEANWVCVQ